MRVITRQNLNEIDKLYLHDAEISKIISDYIEHIVKMPVKLYEKGGREINATIIFENVLGIDISFLEPWGAGMYVLWVIVEPLESTCFRREDINIMDYFKVSFVLSSGDKINIVASKMVLDIHNR